jgi:hypothetical protein
MGTALARRLGLPAVARGSCGSPSGTRHHQASRERRDVRFIRLAELRELPVSRASAIRPKTYGFKVGANLRQREGRKAITKWWRRTAEHVSKVYGCMPGNGERHMSRPGRQPLEADFDEGREIQDGVNAASHDYR